MGKTCEVCSKDRVLTESLKKKDRVIALNKKEKVWNEYRSFYEMLQVQMILVDEHGTVIYIAKPQPTTTKTKIRLQSAPTIGSNAPSHSQAMIESDKLSIAYLCFSYFTRMQ